ncbi:uncharacterized protein LDX57_002135 [Aspergillus melleus]|uniref:uncharacterized protein n=1 Tax=Aspergillus melleus TaxID=138277 RepID=UPI001E8CC0C3|nr:uncharacterized protein LDX57_002135 [Aspergillus melleus]KAH8424384.1 hypothetical protein LDX57_002135 [Aspergillus melleus]
MGRSLEEIDLVFRKSPSVFSTVQYAKKNPHLTVEESFVEEKADMKHEENV